MSNTSVEFAYAKIDRMFPELERCVTALMIPENLPDASWVKHAFLPTDNNIVALQLLAGDYLDGWYVQFTDQARAVEDLITEVVRKCGLMYSTTGIAPPANNQNDATLRSVCRELMIRQRKLDVLVCVVRKVALLANATVQALGLPNYLFSTEEYHPAKMHPIPEDRPLCARLGITPGMTKEQYLQSLSKLTRAQLLSLQLPGRRKVFSFVSALPNNRITETPVNASEKELLQNRVRTYGAIVREGFQRGLTPEVVSRRLYNLVKGEGCVGDEVFAAQNWAQLRLYGFDARSNSRLVDCRERTATAQIHARERAAYWKQAEQRQRREQWEAEQRYREEQRYRNNGGYSISPTTALLGGLFAVGTAYNYMNGDQNTTLMSAAGETLFPDTIAGKVTNGTLAAAYVLGLV